MQRLQIETFQAAFGQEEVYSMDALVEHDEVAEEPAQDGQDCKFRAGLEVKVERAGSFGYERDKRDEHPTDSLELEEVYIAVDSLEAGEEYLQKRVRLQYHQKFQ